MVQNIVTAMRGFAGHAPRIPGIDRKTLLSGGSVLAALAASVCCLVPLILLSLGVTGAWLGNFNALYPYKPYLIGVAVALLAARYVSVYRKRRKSCDKAKACGSAFSARFDKVALWVSTALIIVVVGLPYAAPWLLSGF